MTPGVEFEILWFDEDLVEVRVRASNGAFAGAAEKASDALAFETLVGEGEADAGLIIHEGQLTYRDYGLHALFDSVLEEEVPPAILAAVDRRHARPVLALAVAASASAQRLITYPAKGQSPRQQVLPGDDRAAAGAHQYRHHQLEAAGAQNGDGGGPNESERKDAAQESIT